MEHWANSLTIKISEPWQTMFPEVHLQKLPSGDVLKKRFSENMQQIYRRHPCRSSISITLQSNFIEITLRHGCSPVGLLHILRTPFSKNSSG